VIIKYDNSGNSLWSKYYDYNNTDDDAYTMFVDNQANVYITGSAMKLRHC
jgi:hypothetical protein